MPSRSRKSGGETDRVGQPAADHEIAEAHAATEEHDDRPVDAQQILEIEQRTAVRATIADEIQSGGRDDGDDAFGKTAR